MPDRRTAILEAACRVIAGRGVRGLRVEEVAKEARVSVALIYYHFTDRTGLLGQTLRFVNDRADRYTEQAIPAGVRPAERLERMLLLEFQDTPTVRENSATWGELRASAIFENDLRAEIRASTESWVKDVAAALQHAKGADPQAGAERLTSLVEGLSQRWLSGSMSLDRARELVRQAVAIELGGRHGRSLV